MREVIALFAESGTVDDIGIGVVRDAFSDLLFPGLSTVQTRVRYFFFVPWVYERLEAGRISSERAEERARRWELDLIRALQAGGEQLGVIGGTVGDQLKQLPSFIYWNGLRIVGVRQFSGTRSDYFRSMNALNAQRSRRVRGEGGEPSHLDRGRWHHHLPSAPSDLWESATFVLTDEEAEYLRDRFAAADPNSLLAHLVRSPRAIDNEIAAPWLAVVDEELRPATRERVDTARYFSETIYGAQLLYNVMLSERAAQRGLPNGERWLEGHRSEMAAWQSSVEARRSAIEIQSRPAFWQLVYGSGARVTPGARRFVDAWLDLVGQRDELVESTVARTLIAQRERTLKKGLSRLRNDRALEMYQGAAGASELSFRWAQGRAAVNDIAEGLGVAGV